LPRRSRIAKPLRISRHAAKSRCARGWGGWGRLSEDGSRQHNSSQSGDPWAEDDPTSTTVRDRALGPTQCGIGDVATKCTKGGREPNICRCMLGAVLSWRCPGRRRLRCQPCSRIGTAVRNDREGRGNDGIIQARVRASTLPNFSGHGVPKRDASPPRPLRAPPGHAIRLRAGHVISNFV
jgi:hypothetical protein